MSAPFLVPWALSWRQYPVRFIGNLATTILLCCVPAISAHAAAIRSVTQGPVFAVRGDSVVLAVEPSSPDAKVEWWFAEDVICESLRCEFDTSEFTPGEYIYHIVVRDKLGLEVAEVSISTEKAPPLYKPKKLTDVRVGPNKMANFIENGKWLMMPQKGFISTQRKVSPKKTSVINFAEKPIDGRRYRVSHDGLVLLRRVGHQESWIILGGGSFKFEQEKVSLVSGIGVWRKSRVMASPSQGAKVFGVDVETQADQVIVATSNVEDEGLTQKQIRNLQGPAVQVRCPGDRKLELQEKSQIDISESIKCSLSTPDAWSNIEQVLVKSFPWWAMNGDKTEMDRWRMEAETSDLFAKGDNVTDSQIKNAFDAGRCADVLDLVSRFATPSGDATFSRARCQLTFGMRKEALKSLNLLELQKFNPPITAFLMARVYHQSGQFQSALKWYELAHERRYEDRPNLARYAVEAARELGQSRTKLAWLDTVALTENDPQKIPVALQNVSLWRHDRPTGAVLEFGGLMDSQAVPVNSKEVSSMPNKMKASRALVAAFDGTWWSNYVLAKNATLLVSGGHIMRFPTGVRQSAFTVGKHDLRLGLAVDARKPSSEQANWARGWLVQPGVVLGVGMLGSYRVRERFGWEIKLSYSHDKNYSVTFMSDKYLDPAPGGVDIVDIDLQRFTAPGDFSHVDNVIRGEITGASGQYGWTATVDYGRVDYRLPESIGFDHNLSRVMLAASYRVSPAMLLEISPKYTARSYYEAGADESCLELESSIGWRPVPLWMGKFLLTYENRRVSNDPTSSWKRYIYGVSALTDL